MRKTFYNQHQPPGDQDTYIRWSSKLSRFSIESIMNCEDSQADIKPFHSDDEYCMLEKYETKDDCAIYKPQRKRRKKCNSEGGLEKLTDKITDLIPQQENDLERTRAVLECSDLWSKFHELGTEMIITKAGRRMFPVVRVRFDGLVPNQHYIVMMDIEPVDDMRYRYAYHRSTWLVAGKADPPPAKRRYLHPDCPFTSDQLLNQVVSFEKVKLTNNEMDQNGHVILNSMHKYQPRVIIMKRPVKWDGKVDEFLLQPNNMKTFRFEETTFIAVTAYQNQLITKLKINSNPFAKGFRDSSRFVSAERSSKISPVASCRCNPEPPYYCPHSRGQLSPDSKESLQFFTHGAVQPPAVVSSPTDVILKSSQMTQILNGGSPLPTLAPYLTSSGGQPNLEYAFHRYPAYAGGLWYSHSQTQQQPLPGPETLHPTLNNPSYLAAQQSVWNTSTTNCHLSQHTSRYRSDI